MIHQFKCAYSVAPTIFIFLLISISISMCLVFRNIIRIKQSSNTILLLRNKLEIEGYLAKIFGRSSFLVWGNFVLFTILDICYGLSNSAILIPPLSVLAPYDVIAISILGIMASASYSFCFIAEMLINYQTSRIVQEFNSMH